MKDWLETEYERVNNNGKFDNGLPFHSLMNGKEVAIINSGKIIYKKDLKHYFFEEFKIDKEEIPFNVGKDFYNEWNKKDIWRK